MFKVSEKSYSRRKKTTLRETDFIKKIQTKKRNNNCQKIKRKKNHVKRNGFLKAPNNINDIMEKLREKSVF